MSSEPKCMKCDKHATHKITKIIKGKVYDILLCGEHAQQFSPWIKTGGQTHLIEILHQILKQQENILDDTGPACPSCGLSWTAYRKTLLLGCSDCYDTFASLLVNDLRKMHGTASHFASEQPASPGLSPEMFPDAAAALPKESETPESHAEDEFSGEGVVDGNEDVVGLGPEDVLLSAERIRERMDEAARQENFEMAARLRDILRQIDALRPNVQELCSHCGSPMVVMHGIKDFFLACAHYPACPTARPLNNPTPGPADSR